MQDGEGRHAELAGELIEWWEDLWQRGMTSRVVLVAVPPGWGRTTVLDRLAETAGGDDAPVTLIVRINGRELPGETGLQAAALRKCLAGAADPHRVAELLGMDRLGGSVQMGIGIGALFVSGPVAGVAFLLAGVAVGAAGKTWDDSPAGQDGAVARAARAVAAVSARVPVVVIIDDADCLDEGLALTMIENLAARQDGHVLVVAAVDPDGALKPALTARSRTGPGAGARRGRRSGHGLRGAVRPGAAAVPGPAGGRGPPDRARHGHVQGRVRGRCRAPAGGDQRRGRRGGDAGRLWTRYSPRNWTNMRRPQRRWSSRGPGGCCMPARRPGRLPPSAGSARPAGTGRCCDGRDWNGWPIRRRPGWRAKSPRLPLPSGGRWPRRCWKRRWPSPPIRDAG